MASKEEPHKTFTRERLQKMATGTAKAAKYWQNELQKKILTGQGPKKKKGKK